MFALACAWVAIVRPGPLSLPYFWDEADVYVPGARWLAEHGFDITPAHFDDDYSRGHPPLFYLYAALAFRLLGESPSVAHLAVLPFTALGIASTYLLGAWTFDRSVGLAAAVLLACTPMYLAIGNMLLPEVPLTALSALALALFARRKLALAVLLGVAMVWIKETGIFTAAAIGVGELVQQRIERRLDMKRIALATVPLFALGAFFTMQKLSAGYFVFPHHADLFAERDVGPLDLLTVVPSLFGWHARWFLSAAAGAGLMLGTRRAAASGDPAAVDRAPVAAVVAACGGLVLFNAIFFTQMFWLERYALPAHPGLLVVLAAAVMNGFVRLAPLSRATLRWGLVALVAFVGVLGLRAATPADEEEHTFAYADVVRAHQRACDALGPADAPVLTSWPMTVELEDPRLGYRRRRLDAIHERDADASTTFGAVLVNAGSWRADALRAKARAARMSRDERIRVGVAPPMEIWR